MGRKRILKLPNLFIGSSKEAVNIAEKLGKSLNRVSKTTLWNDDAFKLTKTSIESLFLQLDNSDFGIFIFNADDIIDIKGKRYTITRDNVIFELGLFMGRLGRERCIMILPKKQLDFRVPTDLLGIAYSVYDHIKKIISVDEKKKLKELIKRLGKI